MPITPNQVTSTVLDIYVPGAVKNGAEYQGLLNDLIALGPKYGITVNIFGFP